MELRMYYRKFLEDEALRFIVIILVFSISAFVFAKDREDLSAAHKFYEEGKYEEAIATYSSVAQKIPNGHIYFNIANCYFRLNELGKALFYYKKAQKLIPRDPELVANINYVRSLAKDKIEDRAMSSITKKAFFWYYLFNLKTLVIITVIINFLFCCTIFFKFWKKDIEFFQWGTYILFSINIIFIITTVAKFYYENYTRDGVVIVEETDVRSGFGIGGSVLFKLHTGAEFSVLETNNEWAKIELIDEKKGWVSSKDIIYE